MRAQSHPAARSGRDGFVLIAVLWILAALAGLIGAYVAYALTMAQGSDFYLRRVASDAALSGGLELAVYDLQRLDPKTRPNEGVFDYQVGDYRVQVRYASESLRLDLNVATPENLVQFLREAGIGGAFADAYARSIVAWREKPATQGARMEDLSYRAAGATYLPRHGSFQSVEELWDVRDIPPEVVGTIVPLVTVYGGSANPGEQAAAVANAPNETAPAQPGAPPPAADVTADGAKATPLQANQKLLKPTRFVIRAIDSAGRANAVEAVAMAARSDEIPYNVLLWRTGDDVLAPRDGLRR